MKLNSKSLIKWTRQTSQEFVLAFDCRLFGRAKARGSWPEHWKLKRQILLFGKVTRLGGVTRLSIQTDLSCKHWGAGLEHFLKWPWVLDPCKESPLEGPSIPSSQPQFLLKPVIVIPMVIFGIPLPRILSGNFQESLGFWFPRWGFWIPGTRFQSLLMHGTWILDSNL